MISFSFSFNSLAMRSSPQKSILCGHLLNEAAQVLEDSRSADRSGFPVTEETEPLAVPTEEGVGLDVHQGVTPREQAAASERRDWETSTRRWTTTW